MKIRQLAPVQDEPDEVGRSEVATSIWREDTLRHPRTSVVLWFPVDGE
jgi:hypothetical protein